jgi:hypothetical protein
MALFEGEYIGLNDKHGNPIHNGDRVRFYYKGEYVVCTIIYSFGMFCLQWQDGYINKHPLNPEKYEIVKED